MGSSSQQQYCLKWNNHQSNLLRVFNRLLGSEQFTDVLIAAEGQTVRAHKVVLSACSSYFETLFSNFNEKNQIVILKDTKYDDISAIVEFMYKGEISVVQDQLSSLLKTAENLKVKGLAEVTGDDKCPTSSTAAASCSSSTSGRDSVVEIAPKPPKTEGSPASPRPKKRGRPARQRFDSSSNNNNDEEEISPYRPGKIERVTVDGGPPNILKRKSKVNNGNHRRSHRESVISSSDLHADEGRDDIDEDERLIKSEEHLAYMAEDSPTPGGPLTMDRIQSLGIIKMNEYLQSGTRQQFWDEYFIKVVMQGIRNKEIDMKSASEILGVSYGTLYGRYRETFGYLKHAWNVGGRPPKMPFGSKDMGLASLWTDPQNDDVIDQLKRGRITIKEAAEMLGMESSLLAYQLTGKIDDSKLYDEEDDEDQLMEVQPDIILRQDEVDPIDVEEN